TAFWQAYVRFHEKECALAFSMAGVVRERASRQDFWPRFAAGVLPPNVLLQHKPSMGRVDLTFQKSTRAELLAKFDHLLPANAPMQIISVRPSAALSHPVSMVIPTEPFDEQEARVREVFLVVQKFLSLWPVLARSMG